MNFAIFSPRLWFLLGFLGCCAMLGFAAYLQFVQGMEPCPLCISQRLAIMATGILFLLAAIHNRAHHTYAIAGIVSSLIGASISARHVWLQHLPPDQVPECGPGLAYVFEHFPLTETLKLMLSGTGECAEIEGVFLGLALPAWTLIAFLLLAAYSAATILIKKLHESQP